MPRERGESSRDRARDRERRREREYIRGDYEEDSEGFPSAEGGSDLDEERRRAERRERRRRREEEERMFGDVMEGRKERSKAKESPATSPTKRRDRDRDRDGQRRRRDDTDRDPDAEARRQRRRERQREKERERERSEEVAAVNAARKKHKSSESSNSASGLLNADSLARLASEQELEEESAPFERRERSRDPDVDRRERRRRKQAALAGAGAGALGADFVERGSRHRSGARVVSGAYLEEGRSSEMNVRRRGGGGSPMGDDWERSKESWVGSFDGEQRPSWKFWAGWSKKKRICIGVTLGILALLAIIIPVAVIEAKKNSPNDPDSSDSSSSQPSNSNLDGISKDSIPLCQGTVLDPWTWYETEGFNVTFTNETVGGLYIMGLNSSWDDSARPNPNVPPLNEKFPYGSQPIRGVNLGGWLSIEPFIAPSLFDRWPSNQGVIDEWTLSAALGSSASTTIEKHYAEFLSEQDFAEIQEAGLDHVRIQYSYWAVTTYDGDPYVPKIAWRYLLRAIEYCRKYGLRVKLDLHGIPGSQNGWNHSGRQGLIRWLNGTDGDLNRQRSLDVHNQLSKFFAQDRYKNVITLYGLVNEPLMLSLPVDKVLDWTQEATELVRKNGINQTVVFHDGFLNLNKWHNMFKDHPDNMYLDTHQYTIFNTGEIVLNHTAKIELICNSWYPMIQAVNSTSTGWGPTMCGEWSQADTDCGEYLNEVGVGTRWEGTYGSETTAYCPTASDGTCSCDLATADLTTYSSAYKKWLQMYAEAQMSTFETAMGWFYWTWRTESLAQWSYRTAWKNGFMPSKAYSPSFKCGDDIPDFSSMGLANDY
ncbi:Exo-beta-1-3-glucanase [Penicillium chermesinum]|nr:Exo-beta-1-3-glucanase [Penicillium chermesinum]